MNLINGETVLIWRQWAQVTERNNATISASDWDYDGTATLSGASLATPRVTVLFTPTSDGILTNTVTMSDGQVLKYQWEVSLV